LPCHRFIRILDCGRQISEFNQVCGNAPSLAVAPHATHTLFMLIVQEQCRVKALNGKNSLIRSFPSKVCFCNPCIITCATVHSSDGLHVWCVRLQVSVSVLSHRHSNPRPTACREDTGCTSHNTHTNGLNNLCPYYHHQLSQRVSALGPFWSEAFYNEAFILRPLRLCQRVKLVPVGSPTTSRLVQNTAPRAQKQIAHELRLHIGDQLLDVFCKLFLVLAGRPLVLFVASRQL
jgi:hypothetical protein